MCVWIKYHICVHERQENECLIIICMSIFGGYMLAASYTSISITNFIYEIIMPEISLFFVCLNKIISLSLA